MAGAVGVSLAAAFWLPRFHKLGFKGEGMSTVELFSDEVVKFEGRALQTGYYKRVEELLVGARVSVWLCQYVFAASEKRGWQRSTRILKAVLAAGLRGVDVRVLFDRPRPGAPNAGSNIRTWRSLEMGNVEVRCLAVNKTLHVKLVIVDREVLLAGSHNLTNSSLYSPFELSWECVDSYLVNSAALYFQCLWNGSLSEPFSDGFKRMGRGGDGRFV